MKDVHRTYTASSRQALSQCQPLLLVWLLLFDSLTHWLGFTKKEMDLCSCQNVFRFERKKTQRKVYSFFFFKEKIQSLVTGSLVARWLPRAGKSSNGWMMSSGYRFFFFFFPLVALPASTQPWAGSSQDPTIPLTVSASYATKTQGSKKKGL